MNSYPVEWKGRTLLLHDITAGDKEAFCVWAKRWNGMQQIETWGHVPAVLNPLLADIPALVFWGDRGPSPLVSKTLAHPDGDLQLNKILLGDSARGLSDADLREMIESKTAEQTKANEGLAKDGHVGDFPPANDYYFAMQAIQESSDPKAARATGTGPPPSTGS